jgi:hypothetical protein
MTDLELSFDPDKLLKLRQEMIAAHEASDRASREAEKLRFEALDAAEKFNTYALGGQNALDRMNSIMVGVAGQGGELQGAQANTLRPLMGGKIMSRGLGY